MELKIAYLSQGKLFFKHGDLAAREIDSEFGQDVVNRALQRYQKDEWKTGGRGSLFSGSMLWGAQDMDPGTLRADITGVTGSDQDGELLFALATNYVGGLFRYDWAHDEEKRVFHKENFRVKDLDRHPKQNLVACSQHSPSGTANIGIIQRYGLRQVTEGDSVDAAPSWIPNRDKELVFQSAGIARNTQGFALGLGPFAIQRLDLNRGTLTTLLDDPNYDFLLPHLDADGTLTFIRRPYEMPGRPRFSVVKFFTDILAFPFRVVRAIIHFLNFFSLTFARKPLITAAGPKMEGADQQTLTLWGRIIDAEKALRESARDQENPSLVPPSWELVRRRPSGDESTLAKGVVAFDIDRQGRIVYTNGSAIYQLELDKNNNGAHARLLLKGHLIESLVIIN